MNHKVLTALLAVACALAPTQQASAWSRLRFNISMNFSWEGANNSFLWGLIKGGPGGPSSFEGDGGGGQAGAAAGGYTAVPSPYSNAMAYSQQGYGYNPYAGYGQQMQQQAPAIQQANYSNYANYYYQQPAAYPQYQASYPYSYGRGYYPQNGW